MKCNDLTRPRATLQRWEQIRQSYVLGEGSLVQLAARHGVNLSTMEARCRREGWCALRKQRQDAALERTVGAVPATGVVAPVGDSDWWAEHDRQHLHENIAATQRLRRAVDNKIPTATAGELERLANALQAVVASERVLLELSPHRSKHKGPTLRPGRFGDHDRHSAMIIPE